MARGDDADVAPFFDYAGFAERDGVVRAGVFERIVRLAVKMLMLQDITGSSHRTAVRRSPATSSAEDGMTTRKPGQCVKMDSPLWL